MFSVVEKVSRKNYGARSKSKEKGNMSQKWKDIGEVRTCGNGDVDEVVLSCVDVHLEYMSDSLIWIGVTKGSERMDIHIRTKRAIIKTQVETDCGSVKAGFQ